MRRIVLLVGLLTLQGCFPAGNSKDYPQNWPVPNFAASCEDLRGEYLDKGILHSGPPQNRHRFLSFHLFGRLEAEQSLESDWLRETRTVGGDVIRIERPNLDLMIVELRREAEKKERIELTNGPDGFKCVDGITWVNSGSLSQIDGLGYGKSRFKLGLHLGNDGSLIGQVHHSMIGLAMWVIPMAGGDVDWYQWLPARKSN